MARLITATSVGTTVTFTTSQTWTCPIGVVTLLTVVGKGQDGTPATGGGYGPNVVHSAVVATITGHEGTIGGGGFGQWNWSASQSDISSITNAINIGGSGSYSATSIDQYENKFSSYTSTTSWTGALTGSAYTVLSPGWTTSGLVQASDYGFFTVYWESQGTYSGGTSATTGSDTTGFSKTFSGGVSIPATSTTYTNITVIPATGYPLVIPTGGYISITY